MSHSQNLIGNKYCVAMIGQLGIAIPALAVREVMACPSIFQVPTANPVLVGLSHIRNDFVPVISVSQILGEEGQLDVTRASLVLVNGVEGAWAFTVDRACAVVALEAAHVRDAGGDEVLASIVTGTATYRDGVVRVLDTDALYRAASTLMNQQWTSSTTLNTRTPALT